MVELVIGRRYHIKGISNVYVWKLAEVNDQTNTATLKTTRGKTITTSTDNLQDVNKHKTT